MKVITKHRLLPPLIALLLACGGLAPSPPDVPAGRALDKAEPASEEEPPSRAVSGWVRWIDLEPSQEVVEYESDAPEGCQPRLFLPEEHDIEAEHGAWAYWSDIESWTQERSEHLPDSLPEGRSLREFEFPCPNNGPRVLEIRQDGHRVGLFTHIHVGPIYARDGRRAFVRNVVERDGKWVRRARILDLVGTNHVELPLIDCQAAGSFSRNGHLLTTNWYSWELPPDQSHACVFDEGGRGRAMFAWDFDERSSDAPPWPVWLPKDPDGIALVDPFLCRAAVIDIGGKRIKYVAGESATDGEPCPPIEELFRRRNDFTFDTFGEGIEGLTVVP